jgi:mitochondrial fission protein ELM1
MTNAASLTPHDAHGGDARPLAGRTAWLITDGKVGMDVQCLGVADALGVVQVHKRVRPGLPFRLLAPWGRPRPAARFGAPGSDFAPPWPEVAIATGRQSIPYLRAVRAAAGERTLTVVLQDPRTGAGTADLVWVPQHDRLRGPNVITTLTSPHSFSAERLDRLRQSVPPAIAALPRPRVAVVLGGPNAVYRFGRGSIERLRRSLRALASSGVGLMITPSRRTPAAVKTAVEEATRGAPRILWDGEGENPYPDFLAHADALIVTADSVNMTGEACATGRPVYVFEPDGGSAKFTAFHDALRRYGATRVLPETLARLETWTYSPLDSARDIARETERLWLARAKTNV